MPDLRGEGEVGGDPAGQVGQIFAAWWPGVEDRAVLEAVLGLARATVEGVVRLGLPPHVVVADVVVVAGADPDLEVQRLGLVVPHLLQLARAEPRLVFGDAAVRAGIEHPSA